LRYYAATFALDPRDTEFAFGSARAHDGREKLGQRVVRRDMAGSAGAMSVALGVGVRLRDIFGKSFGIFARHFVVFFTIAAIVLGPFYLVLLVAVVLRPGGNVEYVVANLMVMLMVVICPTIASGAMTYGVAQDLCGRPVRTLETLNALVRRFLPMMGIAVS